MKHTGQHNAACKPCNIERAKQKLAGSLNLAILRGGNNFRFVSFGDVTELKLWNEKRT